jgi:hypothetical protein
MCSLSRIFNLSFAVLLLTAASPTFAIDEFKDVKTIQLLPMSDAEVEFAHSRTRGETCELIGEGELMETRVFAMNLTDRDRRENARRPPSARHPLFTVGLSIDSIDQEDLPKLSRSKILDYMEQHYVVVQARVRQDLLDRKLYFHHRPIAVTTQFAAPRLTVAFEPVIANSIQEFHSLGLFTAETKRLKPENLRTLVLLFKNNLLVGGRVRAQYEYAFIHGVPDKTGKSLTHHIFVTSKNRNQLNYLTDYRPPRRQRECSIHGSVLITDYDPTGIFPKTSAVKSYQLNTARSYSIDQVNQFCASQNLVDGMRRHLDTVLSAAVEQKIANEAQPSK